MLERKSETLNHTGANNNFHWTQTARSTVLNASGRLARSYLAQLLPTSFCSASPASHKFSGTNPSANLSTQNKPPRNPIHDCQNPIRKPQDFWFFQVVCNCYCTEENSSTGQLQKKMAKLHCSPCTPKKQKGPDPLHIPVSRKLGTEIPRQQPKRSSNSRHTLAQTPGPTTLRSHFI